MTENGRKTESERRAAILAAGMAVFLEQGYVGASMDEIVRRAGGSKRTLYRYFGSKEELFGEIVTGLAAQMIAPLDADVGAGKTVSEALNRLGQQYLEVLLRPDSLALFRIVVAEGIRFPELAEAFYRCGPGFAADRLAGYLREQQRQGTIAIDHIELAARQFISLVRSDIHLRAALGLGLSSKAE
ncbi:MAG: TetR/AcrR family transcriptional regulator, partial [Porticoccaceae bacterium]